LFLYAELLVEGWVRRAITEGPGRSKLYIGRLRTLELQKPI